MTTRDLFDLTGRVALITGGAGHIGSAIADALAERGAAIATVDLRHAERDFCWRGTLTDSSHVADLADPVAIAELVLSIEGMHGRLDILVNCAALLDAPGLDVPFAEQTLETWNRSLAVNLTAPWLLAQACAPMLAASGHGSIINVASIYGVVGPDLSLYGGTGMGCGAAYAASKGGLIQLTRYLATVLPREYPGNIRVNTITPGGIARGQDAAFVERYSARTPLSGMGTESGLAGAALFLASDASEDMTGHNLVVDRGWTAW